MTAIVATTFGAALILPAAAVHADPVDDLVEFTAGTTARADEVNANFSPRLTAILFIALLFCSAQAFAQVLTTRYVSTVGFDTNNPCTFAAVGRACRSIQHAIDVANSGDTISISDGVYTQPLQVVAKNLSFARTGSAGRPVIQAAEQPGAVNARVVTIFGPASGSITVSFYGLLLRHGKANGSGNNGNGGGIFCVQNCILDAQNMFIRSNIADGEGGGIYVADSSGESNLRNVVIEDNEAGRRGGGLRTLNSDVRLHGNARIRRNTAGLIGGGAHLTGGTATFSNVTIGGALTAVGDGNVAENRGGGINLSGTTAVFSNVLIRDNESRGNGGGMYALSSSLNFTDVLFQVNEAASSGGGLHIQGTNSVITLDDINFTNNHAGGNGGGMSIRGGTAELSDVLFFLNSALAAGGGLHNASNGDGTLLENVRFRFNEVLSDSPIRPVSGGGMHIRSSSPDLANVTFEKNRAESPNSAANGAGLSITGGNPRLTNVLFLSNEITASSRVARGGALYVSGASFPTLVNVTMSRNSARAVSNGAGGAIAVAQPSSPLLVNTIVWGNAAEHDGNEFWLNPDTSIDLTYSLYGDAEGDIAGAGEFKFNPDDNSFSADPLFVDVGNGNLRLLPASPAVNRGVPDFSLALFPGGPDNPVDLDGNPRFDDAGIDIGAYELQTVDNVFQERLEE